MNLTRPLLLLTFAVTCLGASGPEAIQPPAGSAPAQGTMSSVDSFIGAGLAHAHQGEWYAAIAAFNDALEIDPASGEALLFRGRAEAASKDYDAALRSFTAALPLLPHEATLYQAIGEVHAARGETGRAADAFSIAAHIYVRQQDRAEALAAIARLREVLPDASQLRELDELTMMATDP